MHFLKSLSKVLKLLGELLESHYGLALVVESVPGSNAGVVTALVGSGAVVAFEEGEPGLATVLVWDVILE